MAGGQERILRRRIRSVQSTKKITRAMELIAASRIVKAQARVAAAVPYADRITDVARHLQESGGSSHPLLLPRPEIRTVALVVIGADRGLCGGYNSSVIRAAEAEIREHARAGRDYTLVTVGRKVEGYFRFRNYRIRASHRGLQRQPLVRGRPRDRLVAARAVRGRRARSRPDRVHAVHLGRPPGSHRPPVAAARQRGFRGRANGTRRRRRRSATRRR